LGLPLLGFSGFFAIPQQYRKITDFLNRRKTFQMALAIDPASSKVLFSMKKHDYCHPFLHRFGVFFECCENVK